MKTMEELYNEHASYVYKYLLCLCHDDELAEDYTQETFCRAIKNIDNFRGECKIEVWLCQIAKNAYFNDLRKKRRENAVSIEANELNIKDDLNIEEDFITNEEKEIMERLIEKLDDKSKEIVRMRISADMSFKEISSIYNKRETWSRVIFYRAKVKLIEMNRKEANNYETK